MKKLTALLRLMRPANIVTAMADVLAGTAIAGSLVSGMWGQTQGPMPLGKLILDKGAWGMFVPIGLLLLSTACLYGGGVVLNDYFDADLDRKERPERPIPSAAVSKATAGAFGVLLLLIGVLSAALVNLKNLFAGPALFAVLIAIAAVVYDRWMKHNRLLGPLTMGLCRGLNLILGMSIFSFALQFFWWLGIVPVIYIAAITAVSRGEVSGGRRKTLYWAAALYNLVIACVLFIAYVNNALVMTLPVLLIFALLIFPALQKAILRQEPARIGKAVKSGVIGIIALNAAWAAAFGDIHLAILILLLLPVSLLLAKLFAVT